jgi:hypothetical protein
MPRKKGSKNLKKSEKRQEQEKLNADRARQLKAGSNFLKKHFRIQPVVTPIAEDCRICTYPISNPVELPCGCTFCDPCISSWMAEKKYIKCVRCFKYIQRDQNGGYVIIDKPSDDDADSTSAMSTTQSTATLTPSSSLSARNGTTAPHQPTTSPNLVSSQQTEASAEIKGAKEFEVWLSKARLRKFDPAPIRFTKIFDEVERKNLLNEVNLEIDAENARRAAKNWPSRSMIAKSLTFRACKLSSL